MVTTKARSSKESYASSRVLLARRSSRMQSRSPSAARPAAEAGLLSSCAKPADSLPSALSLSRCCSARLYSRIRSASYPNEPRKKFRDLLEHFRKALLVQAQEPGVRRGARGEGELRLAGEGQHADHLARASDESNCVRTAGFAPPPDFALQHDKQGIGGISLVQQDVAGVQHDFFRATGEPLPIARLAVASKEVQG